MVASGGPAPSEWAGADRIRVDAALLADVERLTKTVTDLQRRYVNRAPTVFELVVPADELALEESTEIEPYLLGGDFTFLRERLVKVLWHNSYDARVDPPVWWWAHKADARLDISVGGPADVLDPGGNPMWIDGGPRQPLHLDHPVIHHETVELGRSTPVPPPTPPPFDLAPDQLDAVAHLVGPARVIAPAGSGKTRVLTARALHLLEDRGVEPELVTALAYNRRAAEEMASRLPGQRLEVRTIHSLGWEILRMAKPDLRLIDEREQRRRLEPVATAPPRANTDVIGPYLEALDEVRIGLRHPAAVEAERDDVPGFATTFDAYRELLERNGEADHAEQIYGAIEALCRLPDLRAHWQARCRHLLVDEFQDLTPAYLLLIRLVAAPGMNVFGVGDDDQVIYGYAGADPRFLIDFEELFPGAGSHALEVNYRCPADVVESAANLLGYNRRRLEKEVRAHSTSRGLHVLSVPGDELGARCVAQVESLLGDGVDPSAIAVLARVNSALLPIHVALSEASVPFHSPISSAILERTLLGAALAWIRVALDPTGIRRSDLFEVVRRPGRGITRLLAELIGRGRGPYSVDWLRGLGEGLDGRRRERWEQFCDDILTASMTTISTPQLLDVLASEIRLDKAAAALDAGRTRADRAGQGDDLTALRRVAVLGPPHPADFEPWLRDRLGAPTSPQGVSLSTVHRVKGLEWDHVIVFGADRDTMPHQLSNDLEEERRVFHVALTRGRATTTVLADQDRPSRFLAELDGTAPVAAEPAPPRGRVAHGDPGDIVYAAVGDEVTLSGGYRGVVDEVLATGVLVRLTETGAVMAVSYGERVTRVGRAGRLGPGIEPSTHLVDLLKSWRLEQARSQGVPAYVVFNDRTLDALAAMRPSTESDLISVPGIGPAKLEAYGDQLLDLLAND